MLSVDKKTGEIVVSPFSKFRHESVGLDTGSMIIQNYDFAWSDEIRDFIVVEAEKEDRQALIDSFADECGVYNVLKLYAKTGDISLLNRRESFYADVSDLPTDELNPAKMEAAAKESVSKLSALLGKELTGEDLAKMSVAEVEALINEAVAAKTSTQVVKDEPKKDGE